MRHMEYDPTSDDVDRLLADAPNEGHRLTPQAEVLVLLEVPMDGATLRKLQHRAETEGRPLTEVVGDAVRAGAQAA